jgi:uncharacterized membrane protein
MNQPPLDTPTPDSFSHSLRQSFLAGLLALLPLFITWKILALLFAMVDGVLGDSINQVIQRYTGITFAIPGLGLLVTGLVVVGIGWLTRMVFFKRLLGGVEELITRVPIVASLYKASRQVVVPFTDHSKVPFSKVVLVEYPMVGRHTLGLVAQERVSDDPTDDRMVVFFPSNHLHLGYPVVLSRQDVTVIDMSVEDAVKFFVSCGVVGNEGLVYSHGQLIPPLKTALPAKEELPGLLPMRR